MNQTKGRASGEVPESQPSGDLAERITGDIQGMIEAPWSENLPQVEAVIRKSLAPIREALEATEWISDLDLFLVCPLCACYKRDGHAMDCEIAIALRLLRGEEIPGNRRDGGG